MEGYILAIDEQEIITKDTLKRREKDEVKKRVMDSKCRLCKKGEETLSHILGSSEKISFRLCLTYCHDRMGKIIYDEIMKNEKDDYQPAWNVPSAT